MLRLEEKISYSYKDCDLKSNDIPPGRSSINSIKIRNMFFLYLFHISLYGVRISQCAFLSVFVRLRSLYEKLEQTSKQIGF